MFDIWLFCVSDVKKISRDKSSFSEHRSYFKTLNERSRRPFLACKTMGPAGVPVRRLAAFLKVGKNTIYAGRRELHDKGFEVSVYIVKRMIKAAGLKKRVFTKSIPLDVVEDRDPPVSENRPGKDRLFGGRNPHHQPRHLRVRVREHRTNLERTPWRTLS